MSPARKLIFFLGLQIFADAGGLCSEEKQREIMNSSNNPQMIARLPGSQLFAKDVLQFVGHFLKPYDAQKMQVISRQWRDVKIYKAIVTEDRTLAVFKDMNTGEILWKPFGTSMSLPNHQHLEKCLRGNVTNWEGVFLWFRNFFGSSPKEVQNSPFLKELMLATAENIDVEKERPSLAGISPLSVAAMVDDVESILVLIKRGAKVNRKCTSAFSTALHFAAANGSVNACRVLLDHGANIDDQENTLNWTPLKFAANYDKKETFDFLISRGASGQKPERWQLQNFQD